MEKDVAWRSLQTENIQEASVLILGIPFDENCSCGRGALFAPKKMRELSSYLPPVTEEGHHIKELIYDFGDINKTSSLVDYFSEIEQAASKLISYHKFSLFIGGDHSVGIPLKRAFTNYYQNKKIGLIHFDAHADLCDVYNQNPLSHASVNARALEDGFKTDSLFMLGIRSFEIQELELLKKHPEIKMLTAHQLSTLTEEEILKQLINTFSQYDALYLSLDIDVLDPAFAPGTGTPEAGGLSSRCLLGLIKSIVTNLPVKAMDIVEVSPPRDSNDITSWAALKILLEVIYAQGIKR